MNLAYECKIKEVKVLNMMTEIEKPLIMQTVALQFNCTTKSDLHIVFRSLHIKVHDQNVSTNTYIKYKQ